MPCPRCQTTIPELGHYCPACGTDAWADARDKRRGYALQPGESVLSFNLSSSLLPLAADEGPQTYRFALAAGVAVPVVLAVFGLIAAALAAAAVVVPAVYLVYLADVDQWERQPVPVLGGTIVLSGALGVGLTLLWREGLLGGGLSILTPGVDAKTLLVLGVLAPAVGELLRQVGPILLCRRPRFGELLDGLTFGVAAGAAFAATETLVLNRSIFSPGAGWVSSPDLTVWVPIVVTAALVKPVVYGAASGIAVASWAGLGDEPTGFDAQYLRGLAEALALDVAFAVGLYLSGRISGTAGVLVGLGWGVLVAGVAILRLRSLIHVGVMEEAFEATTSGTELRTAAHGTAHCPACELPLLDGANFCAACGTALRAAPHQTRRRNHDDDRRLPVTVGADSEADAPEADATSTEEVDR